MIVDDDIAIVTLFARILVRAGFSVPKCFSNGKELLDYVASINPAQEKLPDIVVIDYNMPVMDGVETSKVLRANYSKLKIVMLSAYKVPAQMRGYFDALLTKPVSIGQLTQTITEVFG